MPVWVCISLVKYGDNDDSEDDNDDGDSEDGEVMMMVMMMMVVVRMERTPHDIQTSHIFRAVMVNEMSFFVKIKVTTIVFGT
ncbi:hypothetical protein STEG23_030799, partial [Scotinomys teguina]